MKRRDFLRATAGATAGFAVAQGLAEAGPANAATAPAKPTRVSQLQQPVAIAMWDFSGSSGFCVLMS